MKAITKEEIANAIEIIFKNTERIHGKSDAIDWIKVAAYKTATYLEQYHESRMKEIPEITDEEIQKYVNSFPDNPNHLLLDATINSTFVDGAKWYREELKKRMK